MSETYRCIYCNKPCKIIDEGEKHFIDCKECGKKELTKLGWNRLKVRGKE